MATPDIPALPSIPSSSPSSESEEASPAKNKKAGQAPTVKAVETKLSFVFDTPRDLGNGEKTGAKEGTETPSARLPSTETTEELPKEKLQQILDELPGDKKTQSPSGAPLPPNAKASGKSPEPADAPAKAPGANVGGNDGTEWLKKQVEKELSGGSARGPGASADVNADPAQQKKMAEPAKETGKGGNKKPSASQTGQKTIDGNVTAKPDARDQRGNSGSKAANEKTKKGKGKGGNPKTAKARKDADEESGSADSDLTKPRKNKVNKPPSSSSPGFPPLDQDKQDPDDSETRYVPMSSKTASSSPGKGKGKRNDDQEVDGSNPFPSPRSPASAKRRSMRMPKVTLQPRFAVAAAKRDTGNAKAAKGKALDAGQCATLIALAENDPDKDSCLGLLNCVTPSIFSLDPEEQKTLLQRVWNRARALPDAEMRRWVESMLRGYCVPRGPIGTADDDAATFVGSSKDLDRRENDIRGYVSRKQWNALTTAISDCTDAHMKLHLTATALGLINAPSADIEGACRALQTRLDAKLLIAAFFQSSACPDRKTVHGLEVGNTTAEILAGILHGDAQARNAFMSLLGTVSVSTELSEMLEACVGKLNGEHTLAPTGGSATTTTSTTTTTSATTTSTSTTATTANVNPKPDANHGVEDVILDALTEILLLEAREGWTGKPALLSDQALCLVLGLFELNRESARQAIRSLPYDDLPTFLHETSAAALSALECLKILEAHEAGPKHQSVPWLHQILSEQDFHIAAIYLKKLARSGISRQELIDLLGARDANGVTALEAAMVKGRSQNVADFLDLIINACEFNPIQSDELREARNGTERLGLFGAIENGGKGVGDAIRAYFKTFEEGGDKKKLLELLMTQDNAGSTGVSALRFALLRDKAEAVEALLRVILESQLLSPDEKRALLLEGEKDVQGVVLSEYVQAQFFDMVLKAYQKAFPKKAIPMEYMGPFSMRERDLTQAELNEIQSIAKTWSGESQQAIKLANMREASWMAMLKKLPATERAKLEEGKRLLHPTAISKTLPAFHAALINGCKEAVGSYIKTVADCAAGADGINPVELILAKKDGGKGDPAFFDAMQGNENGAIAAYIDAVLSSKLKRGKDEDQKRELLLARDKHGMSAFQCAMGSGASRAANAYVDAVLSSSRIDGSYKVDLLQARGLNRRKKDGAAGEGSKGAMEMARATALCPSDAKPEPHLQLVREFDEAIRKSSQLSEQSKALLTQFDKLMGNAKT